MLEGFCIESDSWWVMREVAIISFLTRPFCMVEARSVRCRALTVFATASLIPLAFGVLTLALDLALPTLLDESGPKLLALGLAQLGAMSLNNSFLATVKAPHLPILTFATTLSSKSGA